MYKRRICWPNPDATCLQGGCIYCNDEDWHTITEIRNYAIEAGVLPHRANGEEKAIDALNDGIRNRFYGRVDVK